MGDTLSGIMGGEQKPQSMQTQQPQRAQEQILNPMSGASQMMGAQNMDFSNPQQQSQNFGSSPTNALSNLGRRF